MKTILHITPFFKPNIGGVETHLDDLIEGLKIRNYRQIILTYSPLTTRVNYLKSEIYPNITIRRFKLPGHNLFHRFEKYPLINFIYITPYLFLRSLFWIVVKRPHIDTIHSHGLNSALIGNILKTLFKINRHVTSIYSTYDNVPFTGLMHKLIKSTLNNTDHILTQSNQSRRQFISLGVLKSKISRYYHWLDLNRFKPISHHPSKFTILFVGRLIPAKNSLTLAKIASKLRQLNFEFIGTGPELPLLQKIANKRKNIKLIGDVPYSQLHRYYQRASILCLPSNYNEGWGRVLAESVACGTPVICSNKGGTTEAVNNKVAIFVKPDYKNIYNTINKVSNNPQLIKSLRHNCSVFAKKQYSANNINFITKHY